MPGSDPNRSAYLLLLIAPAFMVSNMLAARWVEGSIPAVALAFWRWAATFLILLPLVLPRIAPYKHALKREWKTTLALGALGMGLCGAPVYLGGQTTTATNIGLIYAASPVLIVLFGRAIWGDPITGRQGLGIGLCLLGVIAIVAKGDPRVLLGLDFVAGDLWILLATVSWAFYSLLLRHRRTELPLLVRFQAIVLGGVVCTLPFYGLEMAIGHFAVPDRRTVLTVLFLALIPGIAAFLLYNRLVAVLGPARTGLIMYLGPLYNAGFAWILLGEAPRSYHLVGAALVLPGIYLATVSGAQKAPVPAPSRA